MGCNMNLCDLLGVPEELECPKCKEIVSTYFDDYDIDCHLCYNCGEWRLLMCCSKCEYAWRWCFDIKIADAWNE